LLPISEDLTGSPDTKKITVANLISGWMLVDVGKYTTTPSSTSRLAMSDTSDLFVGAPIKYTISATTYYGIVTAISANTYIDVAGASLSGDVTALWVGPREKVVQVDLFVGSTYANDTADILAADNGQYYRWGLGSAYLVSFSAAQDTVDTGTEPKINIKVAGTAVSTADSGNGIQLSTQGAWVDNSAVAIDAAQYDIQRNEALEIAVTAAGGTGDAADLSVRCLFVLA
jgi:hypothetical protein